MVGLKRLWSLDRRMEDVALLKSLAIHYLKDGD